MLGLTNTLIQSINILCRSPLGNGHEKFSSKKPLPFQESGFCIFRPDRFRKPVRSIKKASYSSCAASSTSRIFFPEAATLVSRPKIAISPTS
jgi:hypothetical protein